MPYLPIKMRKADLIAARKESKITESTVNGVKVVDVTLTQASRHAAAKYGIGIREVNNANRASGCGPTEVFKGKTTFDPAEFEVAGKEGELAASIYLTGNEWPAMRQWVMGTGDSGDLAFWQKDQQKIIDVKIRTMHYHRCFKLTFWQWRDHSPDYYVSTQYPTAKRKVVRIWGYIKRTDIDALVAEETKRILGKSLEWTYEGDGVDKRVQMTDAELIKLLNAIQRSKELHNIDKEDEVDLSGIGNLGYGAEIIVPFTELRQIGELKEVWSKA